MTRAIGAAVLGTAVLALSPALSSTAPPLARSSGSLSWSVLHSPSPSGYNTLAAVRCPAPTECVAVGFTYPSGVLAERWNGSTWSLLPPVSQGQNSSLAALSCPSTSDCVAVGAYGGSSGYLQTLIEIWDGSSWSVVPSADASDYDNELTGVSCVSTTNCTAVGLYDTTFDSSSNLVSQNLVESWNGTQWTLDTAADTGSGVDQALSAVKCTGPRSCMAVGTYISESEESRDLVLRYDGTEWSVAPSPNASGGDNELNAVTCTKPNACTAVGDYFNASDIDQALALGWNGHRWSLVPIPSEEASDNRLLSVGCISSADCVAVGQYANGAGAWRTLIDSWNGAAWSLDLSPNRGNSQTPNVLQSIASAGPGRWMAVGEYVPTGGGSSHTLVVTAHVSSSGGLAAGPSLTGNT